MIGIIAASETELVPIKERVHILESVKSGMLVFHKAQYKEHELVLVYSGV